MVSHQDFHEDTHAESGVLTKPGLEPKILKSWVKYSSHRATPFFLVILEDNSLDRPDIVRLVLGDTCPSTMSHVVNVSVMVTWVCHG